MGEPAPQGPAPEPRPSLPPEAAPSQPAPTPAPSFEEPAPTPAPAETPAPPAAEPLPGEPLPGEPAATPPAAEPPAAEPPAAEEMPAEPAKPAEDVDDLFKDAPAEKPAEPAPGAEPAKPSDDLDKLFDTPDKKASTSPEKATPSELENLFSEPKEPTPMSTDNRPSRELVAEAERLFAMPAVTPVAAPAAETSDTMRLWTDNTGKFRVRARLVVVGPAHVRLLKENGKFTTVPFSRLSQGDLAFVRRHAEQAIAANF
jgi:hypothetical protein